MLSHQYQSISGYFSFLYPLKIQGVQKWNIDLNPSMQRRMLKNGQTYFNNFAGCENAVLKYV